MLDLTKPKSKTGANYGTARFKQRGDESSKQFFGDCSAEKCWPPLLGCLLRSLFYIVRFFLLNLFQTFSFASAHFKHSY